MKKLSTQVAQWCDLRLDKKYHGGLVAVIKLTCRATGDYFYWVTSDVYKYFETLDLQIREGRTSYSRLEALWYYTRDFHVELITFAQLRENWEKDHRNHEAWIDGREKAGELYQRLIKASYGDMQCVNFRNRLHPSLGLFNAPVYPDLPRDWKREDYEPSEAEEISHRVFDMQAHLQKKVEVKAIPKVPVTFESILQGLHRAPKKEQS